MRGTSFSYGDPHAKGCKILGSMLGGSAYLRQLPFRLALRALA